MLVYAYYTQMEQVAPLVDRWEKNVVEWALAKEIHMKSSGTDEKLQEDVEVWVSFCDQFLTPEGDFSDEDVDTDG
ncbi:hypothetical protein NDU88_001316 [Pleurodeles waltl]|uniref:Uncharacterized protein n=1 Tax=Pleurodeles waltl TaxID=8319 RepID=A0AAV7VW21_PLEWA|nr:hypothetical protein NDU88_001316 [Pleurodeles waltl]